MKRVKISNKVYETVFSFKATGIMSEPIVPTPPLPPPTPPTPPPTPPAPTLYPPFPPVSSYPPNTPLSPFDPIEEPYLYPKPWGLYLLKYTLTYYWDFSPLYATVYNDEAERRYNEFKATVGVDPEDTRKVTASFPTDWGITYTSLGRYPTTGPGIPASMHLNKAIVAWDPYYNTEYQDSDGLDMDYVWAQMAPWMTWIPVIGKIESWDIILDTETPIVWG